MIYRLAGVLFVLSSVVALLFQGVAIAQWSGFLIMCGAMLLWSIGKSHVHVLTFLLVAAGLSGMVFGLSDSLVALFAQVLATWGAMLWAWWPRTEASKSAISVVNGGLTLILLGASVAGFVGLGIIGSMDIVPGYFERLALYSLHLWFVLLGVGVFRMPKFRKSEKTHNQIESQFTPQNARAANRKVTESIDNPRQGADSPRSGL